MGLIRKRGLDTIDYTLLQRRGFIKKPVSEKLPFKVDSRGMIDLTPSSSSSDLISSQNNSESNVAQNPFGFLDTLAQSSSQSSSFSPSLSSESPEVSTIKVKIDDLEYKLAQLVDKLILIESKLDNFEKKVIG